MLITILSAVFVFGLLVLVHEWGHFIVAKLTGMRVDEFAIGFGPKLVSTKRGETVYSIRAIPLGGFNDIAGMDPSDNPAGERGFCEKPVLSRMAVILAGAGMNFVLPVILFFAIFVTMGTAEPAREPIIGAVMEGKSAADAGLQAGDKIISVNGKTVETWKEFSAEVKNFEDGKEISLQYERNSQINQVSVTPKKDERSGRVIIGVQSLLVYERQDVVTAFNMSVEQTKEVIVLMLEALGEIFKSPTEAELSGPLGIAQMAGEVASDGFIPLLKFAALLSLNLGIINLLPIPALDGGYFVGLLLEAVRGKPLSTKALMYTQRFGIAFLLLLMVFATKNDIVRVFFK